MTTSLPDSNEEFCVLNHQRRLALPTPLRLPLPPAPRVFNTPLYVAGVRASRPPSETWFWRRGPSSQSPFASRSLPRALLTSQVNPGSLCRR